MNKNLTPELMAFIENSRKRDGISEKEKHYLELMNEKEVYEKKWLEVYSECIARIINHEKIGSAMHNLNIIDTKIIENKYG